MAGQSKANSRNIVELRNNLIHDLIAKAVQDCFLSLLFRVAALVAILSLPAESAEPIE